MHCLRSSIGQFSPAQVNSESRLSFRNAPRMQEAGINLIKRTVHCCHHSKKGSHLSEHRLIQVAFAALQNIPQIGIVQLFHIHLRGTFEPLVSIQEFLSFLGQEASCA